MYIRYPNARFARLNATILNFVVAMRYTEIDLIEGPRMQMLNKLAPIVILLFAHFGAFGLVLLALCPVAIGALWMVGLMGYFSIPFNPP